MRAKFLTGLTLALLLALPAVAASQDDLDEVVNKDNTPFGAT